MGEDARVVSETLRAKFATTDGISLHLHFATQMDMSIVLTLRALTEYFGGKALNHLH